MKRVILVFVGHYVPGFRMGGPLRSIVNLVDCLHNEFDFRILTSDRDLGDNTPFPRTPTNCWIEVEKAKVYYMPPSAQTLFGISRIIKGTPHDVLYLNSFFSVRFALFPLLARRLHLIGGAPVVIAPRGEFSTGALALKNLKKRIYIAVGRAIGLFNNVVWHASSLHEATDIKSIFGQKADISVASNLSAAGMTNEHHHIARQASNLRIAFVGRISPMKNLDYALQVLGLVTRPVSFSIYGPPEDAAYQAECQRLAERLPPHLEVHWHGAVHPKEVPAIMAAHDLFFLPTRGENFGHVIAEALGAGTPVLVSDTTPWRGLHEAGVGWDLPLSHPQAFADAIDAAATQDEVAAARQRKRVFQYARSRQENSGDVEANRNLFRRALEARR